MAKVKWGKKCPVCNGVLAKRVRRNWWMRLLAGSQKYYCGKCYYHVLFILGISIKIGRRQRKW